MIYLTAIGQPLGGSSSVHIYTQTIQRTGQNKQYIHHHHHHVQEGLGLIPVPCILKIKLIPPSLPRSSYVSSSFWFILQCLFRYPVCVHPLYVLQPLFLVLFYFLYCILCSCFFPNTLVSFFIYFNNTNNNTKFRKSAGRALFLSKNNTKMVGTMRR